MAQYDLLQADLPHTVTYKSGGRREKISLITEMYHHHSSHSPRPSCKLRFLKYVLGSLYKWFKYWSKQKTKLMSITFPGISTCTIIVSTYIIASRAILAVYLIVLPWHSHLDSCILLLWFCVDLFLLFISFLVLFVETFCLRWSQICSNPPASAFWELQPWATTPCLVYFLFLFSFFWLFFFLFGPWTFIIIHRLYR